MKRFLVRDPLIVGQKVQLPPEEARHAYKVLRLGIDDEVLLTDGYGKEAHGRIVESAKEATFVEVLSVMVKANTRKISVEILQAPLKGSRMDWLVEKLTELGVDTLHPVQTEHTVATTEKEDRWIRLVQAAVKQSGNLRPLKIQALLPLADALKAEAKLPGLKLLLSPSAPLSLAKALLEKISAKPPRIVLAIGPEGGFSKAEEEELIRQGFQAVALSHQILRGETAGLTAAAITLHLVDF
ncbi:MAG: 16S rRNA (uracil(1498)-N(3))-methyltransferase [Bacteriovoracia bacterium]